VTDQWGRGVLHKTILLRRDEKTLVKKKEGGSTSSLEVYREKRAIPGLAAGKNMEEGGFFARWGKRRPIGKNWIEKRACLCREEK